MRSILNAPIIAAAQNARIDYDLAVTAADLSEAHPPSATVANWSIEIKAFIRTRVTNTRPEAANTVTKRIERTGRGFHN